jgi:AcrR family transcriptional regulator
MGRQQTLADEEILARARPVFLRRGCQATTREIAAAVGLTWGALALRFGSKRRLFELAIAERDSAAAALAASLMKGLVQAIDEDFAGRLRSHGLTPVQRKALAVLDQGRAVTPSEVSRALALDAGATTRLLDRLLAKQLCLGRRDTGDRRCVQLQITELGRPPSRPPRAWT